MEDTVSPAELEVRKALLRRIEVSEQRVAELEKVLHMVDDYLESAYKINSIHTNSIAHREIKAALAKEE